MKLIVLQSGISCCLYRFFFYRKFFAVLFGQDPTNIHGRYGFSKQFLNLQKIFSVSFLPSNRYINGASAFIIKILKLP